MGTRKYHRKSNKIFRKTRSNRQRGGNINTELIQASRNGRTETVAMLLEKGADMNATDNYGETVLQWASENGHTEIVKMLLEKGADVNAKRNCGNAALSSASYGGYTEIVKMLLKNGAIVNAEDNHGWTALQLASENGRIEIVKMLLADGADVNAKNNDGNTALQVASETGHTDIVAMLTAAAKVRDSKQKTMEQVVNRDVKIPSLSTLAQRQMSTDDRSSIFNHFDMRPSSKLGGKRRTQKTKRKTKKSKKIKKHSKRQRGGGNLFSCPKHDRTSELIMESQIGDLETVSWILNCVTDVNVKGEYGYTALIVASLYGHTKIVKILLKKGRADVNATDNDGKTALIWASIHARTEIVKILLNAGADVNATQNNGDTALIWASQRGYKEIVALLLNAGADVNVTNNDGKTALQWASQKGYKEIEKLLKQHIVQQVVPKHLERQKNKENTDLLSEIMPNELLDEIGAYLGGKSQKTKRKTKKSRRKQKIKIKTKRGGYVYSTDWMTEAKTKGEVIPTIENNKILLRELGFSMNPDTKIIIKPKDTKSNIKYFVYDKNDCDTNHIKNCEPISISKPNTNNPYGRNNGGKRRSNKH